MCTERLFGEAAVVLVSRPAIVSFDVRLDELKD
jgi:hypothetical protein